MLSAYDLTTDQQQRNAKYEINQQVVLSGLYRGGFFDTAAFYGGTCLRIFHGLNRFSEDMVWGWGWGGLMVALRFCHQ